MMLQFIQVAALSISLFPLSLAAELECVCDGAITLEQATDFVASKVIQFRAEGADALRAVQNSLVAFEAE